MTPKAHLCDKQPHRACIFHGVNFSKLKHNLLLKSIHLDQLWVNWATTASCVVGDRKPTDDCHKTVSFREVTRSFISTADWRGKLCFATSALMNVTTLVGPRPSLLYIPMCVWRMTAYNSLMYVLFPSTLGYQSATGLKAKPSCLVLPPSSQAHPTQNCLQVK